ncbi:MAG TPA: hypothetical protein VK966_03290, partial [Longimicrobiales bacterium]|nr:hypothetical protein [Longimicrobiales bacterium]
RKAGATADGTLATEHPVDALIEEIDRVQGREAIILTRPHVGALAAALVRIQDEPGLAGRLVEGGQAHVRREFSWDVVVGRLEALYERLASQRHRG